MGRVFKEFEELCMARGRAFYFAEGFAEGIAEGKDQLTEQVITNMLRRGYSSTEISLCTGVGTDKVAFIARKAGISI